VTGARIQQWTECIHYMPGLEVPAWVAWLTAARLTMLELWRQLMTVPLLPAIPLPHSGAAMQGIL